MEKHITKPTADISQGNNILLENLHNYVTLTMHHVERIRLQDKT